MVKEMERKFVRERQQAGIEAAKKKGPVVRLAVLVSHSSRPGPSPYPHPCLPSLCRDGRPPARRAQAAGTRWLRSRKVPPSVAARLAAKAPSSMEAASQKDRAPATLRAR